MTIINFQYIDANGSKYACVHNVVELNHPAYTHRGTVMGVPNETPLFVYIGKDKLVYDIDLNFIGEVVNIASTETQSKIQPIIAYIHSELLKLSSLNPNDTIEKSKVRGILNTINDKLKQL